MGDLWLVRTFNNRIAGPFTKDVIRKLITDKQLESHDEICQAGSRWIYLYQSNEIYDIFGVDPARAISEDETRVLGDDYSESSLLSEKTPPATPRPAPSESIPDFPELEEFEGTDTALMTSRAFRQLKLKEKSQTQANEARTPEVSGGQVKKLVMKRIAVWLGLFLLSILMMFLIKRVRGLH